MARSMHLSFPSQHRQTIIEVLREDEAVGLLYIFQGQMLDVTARESDAVDICRIEFALEGRRVSHALKQLRRVGLGERFGDIDVVPINCSTYKVPRRKGTGLCRSFGERMPSLEIHTSVVSSSHLTSEHTILALLASAMAASGLLTDNLVLILASFFISPLLSMIMAFTWGLCIGDGALALRGLRNMGAGCLLCFASGALIALMCSLEPNTEGISSPIASGPGIYYGISINSDQITSRGPPASTNVVTAAIIGSIAGVAVALGQSSGIASALAGVTISASLLPPMVNCGLMTGAPAAEAHYVPPYTHQSAASAPERRFRARLSLTSPSARAVLCNSLLHLLSASGDRSGLHSLRHRLRQVRLRLAAATI